MTAQLDQTAKSEATDAQNLGDVNPESIAKIKKAIKKGKVNRLKELVLPLHSADLADLIEQLSIDQRAEFARLMGADLDPLVFTELEENARDQMLEQMEPTDVAQALSQLEMDDAIHVLEDMSEDDQRAVLDAMPALQRSSVEDGLSYPEDSAGRLLQRGLIAVPGMWTVGQVIDYLREEIELPDEFYEIYIVDPKYHPIGTIPLSRLLRTNRPITVREIMDDNKKFVPVSMDQEEVAHLFRQYNLPSVGVVDDEGRLIGMITIDDVVDVIDEEAEEDILRLAGVQNSDLAETVIQASRKRLTWLMVNLGTACLAAFVISVFGATIHEMVALAILMPIVANLGGNAGTQTMTIAVRALATKELTPSNATRLVTRELAISLLNGIILAIIIGLAAGVWFDNMLLGGVLGTALVMNVVCAGLSGILIPITLDKLNIDPAIASSVFLTTITDVIGFLAFLGLGTLLLL